MAPCPAPRCASALAGMARSRCESTEYAAESMLRGVLGVGAPEPSGLSVRDAFRRDTIGQTPPTSSLDEARDTPLSCDEALEPLLSHSTRGMVLQPGTRPARSEAVDGTRIGLSPESEAEVAEPRGLS